MTANSACEQDIEFNKPQASRPRPHSGRATASSCRCVRLFDDRVALVGREMSRKESHFFGCRHRRQVVQTLLTGTLWLERINKRGHGRPIGQDGRKRDGQDERNQRVKKNKEITKKKNNCYNVMHKPPNKSQSMFGFLPIWIWPCPQQQHKLTQNQPRYKINENKPKWFKFYHKGGLINKGRQQKEKGQQKKDKKKRGKWLN